MTGDSFPTFTIRPREKSDMPWSNQVIARELYSTQIFSAGKVWDTKILPAFIAELNDKTPAGVACFRFENDECELVALATTHRNLGVGQALIHQVTTEAKKHNCRRLFLTTSNDNLHALGFYQRRGFYLAKLYPGILLQTQKHIPSAPKIAPNQIPIRDDLELELTLK